MCFKSRFLAEICNSERHKDAGDCCCRFLEVCELIVKEDMGFKRSENVALREPVQRKSSAALIPRVFNVVMSRCSLGAPREVTMETRMAGL